MTRKLGKSRAAFRLNTRRASRKAYSNVSSLGRRRHKRSRRRRGGTTHATALTAEEEAKMEEIAPRAEASEPSAAAATGSPPLPPIGDAIPDEHAVCPYCNHHNKYDKFMLLGAWHDGVVRGWMVTCPDCRKIVGIT